MPPAALVRMTAWRPSAPSPHGEGDLERRVAFVVVDTALHDDDGNVAQEPGNDTAGVALDGGLGKMRNPGVGNGDRLGYRVGHGAEPGAEDDADAEVERAEDGSQKRACLRNLVEVGHCLRLPMCF